MDSNNKYINIKEGDVIKNTTRGEILFYSISQVANLLDQEDGRIRYFTNVFDNILKIEISDKELRYTNKDIDKLEFLITLKNKGMTIKEIQKYCETLPLNIEELAAIKENNDLSIQDIVKEMEESQNNQFKLFSEDLFKEIEESQNNQFKLFSDYLLKEIKQYIDDKLYIESKINKDLYNELSLKIDTLIDVKLSLEDNIKLQLDKFNEISLSRNKSLIAEIKRFENVMERAYYIQQDMDTQKKSLSFIERLFGSRSY